ncbi:MAG: efflux RND transporter periplasmic adaptor subunit [Verrucomicrobia bacterium]|nr:efflux RND transporter periplasmic adaptor subunit [Verrucomicrobiota bacterium]
MRSRLPRPLSIGLLAAALILAGCSRSARSTASATNSTVQPVEVVNVARRDLAEEVNLVGSVAANETAQIRAEIAGQIREILFEEGQHVTRGQVLVKIDDSELVSQLAQATASFRLAELNLERTENLAKSNLISQADADAVRSEYASSKAAVAILRTRLAKTELKAPFDGVTGSREVSVGDYVSTSTGTPTITTINDLSRLKIEFQVPERYLSQVRPGSAFKVQARTEGVRTEIAGEVYFVSAVIDRATRSSEVKGYLLNPPEQIRPGMFANVVLVLTVHPRVLTVPEGAILVTPRGAQVIAVVKKDGADVAEFVPVTLGLRSRGVVEIQPDDASRVTEGTPVVAAGVGSLILYAGARVEPRPQHREFAAGN